MSEESKPNVKATALISVELQIELDDVWGGDVPVSTINSAARKMATELVFKMIKTARENASILKARSIRIKGEPEVTAILVNEKER